MEPKFDANLAHRWFAIEMNNRSWDIIEAETHPKSDLAELIHTAHVSYWHWLHAGDKMNELRALPLLVFAYVLNDVPVLASIYAEKCVQLLKGVSADELTDFDTAITFATASMAATKANKNAEAKQHREAAIHAADMLSPEDRSVFDGLFAQRLDSKD